MRQPREVLRAPATGRRGQQGLYREPVFIKPLVWQSPVPGPCVPSIFTRTLARLGTHWMPGPMEGGVDPAIRARSPRGMITEPSMWGQSLGPGLANVPEEKPG